MNCDLVYVVGRGSIWWDTELRYSLRSVEKHLSGVRNVWIVGHLPDFLQNVNYISYQDKERCKEANIYKKIIRACEQSDISEDFLFMNDDHFLLIDCEVSKFPFYWRTDLRSYSKTFTEGNRYKAAIDNAYRALHARGFSLNSFDVHSPILYNKQKFLNVMPQYDWDQKITYIIKSMYANSVGIVGEQAVDCKINSQMESEEIKAIIEKRKFFSMGNGAIGKKLKFVLDELYPNPSKYERI